MSLILTDSLLYGKVGRINLIEMLVIALISHLSILNLFLKKY